MQSIHPYSRLGDAILHTCGALISLVVVAAAACAYWTISARRIELESEQVQAASVLQRTTEICAAQRQARDRWRNTKNDAEALLASLPESSNDTRLLQQVSDLARKTDVELGNFHPGASADFPSHKELEVRINGTGAYEGVCHFLSGLAQLGRMYRITQLNLTGPSSLGGNCSMDLELRLAFGLKQKHGPAGVAP